MQLADRCKDILLQCFDQLLDKQYLSFRELNKGTWQRTSTQAGIQENDKINCSLGKDMIKTVMVDLSVRNFENYLTDGWSNIRIKSIICKAYQ